MIIKPDNEMLSYSGRIDFDDRLAPVLVYACSSIGMKFTGTSLKAVIANHRSCWTNELGYFIDFLGKGLQDPFSVVLSQTREEQEEERIDISINKMLEEYVWSKD